MGIMETRGTMEGVLTTHPERINMLRSQIESVNKTETETENSELVWESHQAKKED